MMNDGSDGWLSDAQEEYAISFPVANQQLPQRSQLHPGAQFSWSGANYTLSVITNAHFRGVEGELPFKFWDKGDMVFADLRTPSKKFATLDYSDEQPALYLGEFVDFDDLKLKNLRTFEGWS